MPYAPEGNPKTAEIVFIGEAPARWEMKFGRPLVGPSGQVFDQQLETTGIARKRCYLTNVFDFQVNKTKDGQILDSDGNVLWHPRKGFSDIGGYYADALRDEMRSTTANVLVPMGNVALDALCDRRAIMKWRGSIIRAELGEKEWRKCIPTIHPANALHGQYTNRYIIRRDFARVKKEAKFVDVNHPIYDFELNPTFAQGIAWLEAIIKLKDPISVDVEVARRQVSRCCFAWSGKLAISIPYGDGNWTLEQEAELWLKTAQVLEDPDIPKIFQNGLFDMWMLFHIHDILVQGHIDDTMVGNHIVYPDFPKSLAFLTSIYTNQPYYKDMVKHGDVDKADG